MGRSFFEDFLINKFHGAYLTMTGRNHLTLAAIIYMASKTMVYVFEKLHLIPKRIKSPQIY